MSNPSKQPAAKSPPKVLDESKPFGTLFGPNAGKRRYKQGGHFYNAAKQLIEAPEPALPPVPTQTGEVDGAAGEGGQSAEENGDADGTDGTDGTAGVKFPDPFVPAKADKQLLEAYARERFNVELDRRRSITALRAEVRDLMATSL